MKTLPPPDLPSQLPRKQENLLHRIEKAGVRASHRAGHPVSREELLDLKIQIIPFGFRLLTAVLSLVSTWAAYIFWTAGELQWGIFFGCLSLLLLLFTLFGVRRTLTSIFENMDPTTAAELMDLAFRAIFALAKAAKD